MFDVAIVGAGVIGASVAYYLSRYDLRVVVLERENDVAAGTTKANSAIVHAGYDAPSGSLMARYNVRGSGMMAALCRDLSVPYKNNGSFVLAFDDTDRTTLEKLYARGVQNGVEGLAVLEGDEVRRGEPNIAHDVVAALWAPTAAIVDPWQLCIALMEAAVLNGAELRRSSPVTGIVRTGDHYRITTPQGAVDARMIINAAGTHADTIYNMVAAGGFRILPDKGEYHLLDKSQGALVSSTIFQCPTDKGKGILVAPTVHGNLITGPTAEPTRDPDDVATTAGGLHMVETFARKSVSSIDFRERIRNFAGVRAIADCDDFIVGFADDAPDFINVAAIKSPGLSAAPAIGEDVARMAAQRLSATEKEHYETKRDRVSFKELPPDEQRALIERDRTFAHVVCRCETITEGEILAAIRSPIPPVSIDGVKRRCNAGMGRCQGGFCGPRVHEILARELKIPLPGIPQDKDGSVILTGQTKEGRA